MLENPLGPTDYVIATGQTHHAEEYLDITAKHFNLRWQDVVKIDKSRLRPREVKRLVGDPSKAQRELGFRPDRISFADHLRLMCEYDYALEGGLKPVRPDVFALFP
jgi:GDPmannose 4,6-dehydratase